MSLLAIRSQRQEMVKIGMFVLHCRIATLGWGYKLLHTEAFLNFCDTLKVEGK